MNSERSDGINLKKLMSGLFPIALLLIYLIYLGANNEISPIQYQFLLTEILIASIAQFSNLRTEGYGKIIYNLFLIVLLSVLTAISFDLFNDMYATESETGFELTIQRLAISCLFCFFLYFFFIALTGRVKGGVITGVLVLFLAGFISYTVEMLRGSRLTFADIGALKTAFDIAGGYNYIPVEPSLMLGIFSFFCMIPVVSHIQKERFKFLTLQRLCCYFIFLFGFYGVYSTPFETLNYSWFETENSYVYSFFANAKLLTIKAPTHYEVEETETIIADNPKASFLPSGYNAKEVIKKTFPNYVKETGTTDPNIIVVMNESLSDLEVFGDIDSEPIFPFLDSLGNTIRGDLFTEVKGGGTADSEYTFLTGNSALLLPLNARPYQLYVNEDSMNLVSNLKNQGYETIAIHPGIKTSWDRDRVYSDFGFEKYISSDSFTADPYKRNAAFRTDLSTYNKIFQAYQEKSKNPLFVFDVTIQNHGGYNLGYENLYKIQANEDLPEDLVEFLSLMRASDQDFESLIDYFSKVDEPTVVCMFGDHQPTLTSGYVDDVIGKQEKDYDLKESQRVQVTPYIIWANYELPKEGIGSISINYLSSLLMECAGLEKTKYQNYLANLYQDLIVINRKGIITKDREYYAFNDPDIPDEYQEDIENYRKVLYYNMIDTDNVDPSLFEINPGG